MKEWFGRQEHLSLAERKISERAMLEVLEGLGLNVLKGDKRIRVGKDDRRKLTAIANFEPKEGEKWSALLDEHLWSALKLGNEFDVF